MKYLFWDLAREYHTLDPIFAFDRTRSKEIQGNIRFARKYKGNTKIYGGTGKYKGNTEI